MIKKIKNFFKKYFCKKKETVVNNVASGNSFSIFGGVNVHLNANWNKFANNLPEKTIVQIRDKFDRNSEDIYFIGEILSKAQWSDHNHQELTKLLEKYLNSNIEIDKLKARIILNNLNLLNKKLIKLISLIYLIEVKIKNNNTQYFLKELASELKTDYHDILLSTNEDKIDYLISIGLLENTSGNFNVDYEPIFKRIAFLVWCHLQIDDQEQRNLLETSISNYYKDSSDFKLMCDFLYKFNLHKYLLTFQGKELGILCSKKKD
jgi:hypothetical protein